MSDSDDVRSKFEKMIAPFAADRTFAKGWRLADVSKEGRVWKLRLEHRGADRRPVLVELHPQGSGPAFAQTNHFDVRHEGADLSSKEMDAVRAITHAMLRNGF